MKKIVEALSRAADFIKEIALEQPVTLFANPWLSLKRIGNYVYSSETRSNAKLVAVLIFDSSKPRQYYGRFEDCPSHFDGIKLCALTGGVEDDDPLSTAIHEIKEESGFTAEITELLNLGTVRSSKSSDTTVYLYAWDAKGKTPENPQGDGSAGEIGSYCDWVQERDYAWCKDPLAATLILRFKMDMEFSKSVQSAIDDGLNIRDLADKCEVAPSTVLRWASGVGRPHPGFKVFVLEKIAEMKK